MCNPYFELIRAQFVNDEKVIKPIPFIAANYINKVLHIHSKPE